MFRPQILRAFGVAGVCVILVAVATALTLVPALLRLAGRRLIRPGIVDRVPGLRTVLARTGDVAAEEGAFSALAARVQRRPWWVLLGSLALLGVLAVPLAHLEMRNSTTELLPRGSDQRAYVQTIADQYPASQSPGSSSSQRRRSTRSRPGPSASHASTASRRSTPPRRSGRT